MFFGMVKDSKEEKVINKLQENILCYLYATINTLTKALSSS